MTARDKGHVEEIIMHLKRVENDYKINLTSEMEWLRDIEFQEENKVERILQNKKEEWMEQLCKYFKANYLYVAGHESFIKDFCRYVQNHLS